MNDDTVIVPMAGFFILLDAEDVDRVMEHNWNASGSSAYAQSATAPGKTLHRFLLGDPVCETIDHRKGNSWDNRKANLREATRSQNSQNSRNQKNSASKYKGVSIVRRPYAIYWLAQIKVGGKWISLGRSKDEATAARMYDAGATKYFGEFARRNFP